MDKRYQVFVSSTYADLKDERQRVIQTLMEMDCIPSGMELFPAADEETWEFIKRVIDDCDYYLLIIGGRYGSITPEGISYTEKEYDYAFERGMKVIAFLHSSPKEIPAGKSEMNPELRERLLAFRNKVSTNRLVKFWKAADELPGLVALSLSKTIKTYPAIGWVRADKIGNAELLNELNELRKKKEELEIELARLQRVTFPTGEVVRAWFDTVINPLIDALNNERRTTREQRWVWDRFNQTIDGIRLLSSFSGNLEQFVLSHSDVGDLLRQHDNAVLHLIGSVKAFYEAVKDSDELKSAYEEATTPDMIRKMVEANPHNSVFTSNSNDQQILQSLLGPEEAIRFGTLAQAIVNETEEMPQGSSMGHAPFWNLHRDKLIEVGRSRPFETFRKQAEEALENLYIAIDSAEQRLREMREELGRKHGQPYVMETPSYGMASSMDRPLGWYR